MSAAHIQVCIEHAGPRAVKLELWGQRKKYWGNLILPNNFMFLLWSDSFSWRALCATHGYKNNNGQAKNINRFCNNPGFKCQNNNSCFAPHDSAGAVLTRVWGQKENTSFSQNNVLNRSRWERTLRRERENIGGVSVHACFGLRSRQCWLSKNSQGKNKDRGTWSTHAESVCKKRKVITILVRFMNDILKNKWYALQDDEALVRTDLAGVNLCVSTMAPHCDTCKPFQSLVLLTLPLQLWTRYDNGFCASHLQSSLLTAFTRYCITITTLLLCWAPW